MDFEQTIDPIDTDRERRHGTAISWRSKGVLLLGTAGSGKSLLARHLVDRGWGLVGDDQVHIMRARSGLFMAGDSRLKGLIEIRGLGIVRVCPAPPARLVLAAHVILSPKDAHKLEEDRVPEDKFLPVLGHEIPLITLSAYDIGVAPMLDLALREIALK